jgi:hypothetical protein
MAERLAIVRAVHGDRVELEALGACRGCACAGACVLSPGASLASLPAAWFARPPRAGERVRLSLDDAVLRRASLALYGGLLAGLTLGALAGAAVAARASTTAGPNEWVVAAGAGCGMLLAWRRSQRSPHDPAPTIESLQYDEPT